MTRGVAHFAATIERSGRRWLVRLHEARDFDGDGIFRPNPLVSEKVGWRRPCDASPPHVSRRVVLMAGALVPAVWIAPQIVSVPIAWATPPGSAPPKTPAQPMMGPPLPRDLPGLLPFTGQNAVEHAELGVAAVVAGAAVVAVTHERRKLT